MLLSSALPMVSGSKDMKTYFLPLILGDTITIQPPRILFFVTSPPTSDDDRSHFNSTNAINVSNHADQPMKRQEAVEKM